MRRPPLGALLLLARPCGRVGSREATAGLREARRGQPPLARDVALITDGRFSGGSHGFVIGHVTPEAYDGGPIGLVEDGDRITVDAEKREINLHVSDAELATRREKWQRPADYAERGTLAKYARLVTSASEGAVTDKF